MISQGVFGLQVSPRFKSRKSIFKINCICQNNSPFFSQYLLDVGPWTHCLKRGSGWLSCLLQTWRTIDFHFAKISSPNPSLVEVAHQCKWFLMALCHFTRSSHPLSFPTWSSFFDTDLATCQMSKKCLVADWHINPPTTCDSLRSHDQGNNFFDGNSLAISTLIYYAKFYKDFWTSLYVV